MTMNLKGKVSWFGGPNDTGVAPDEGLAFIYDTSMAPHLFLPQQPPGTTGLARRLNPNTKYIALRFDYDDYPKDMLLGEMALVTATKTGKQIKLQPADWGPHVDTERVADISPSALEALGIDTDDEVEVIFPYTDRTRPKPMPRFDAICISSGHGLYVRGAAGIIDEVNEARQVTEDLAEVLRTRGVDVATFHDNVSKTQSENLNRITDWHNDQERDLDISVHFNAFEQVDEAMGCEVWWVTQEELARQLSHGISTAGLKDRGPKKSTTLHFLNQTHMPSVLLEICFVDSQTDCDTYQANYDQIILGLADVLTGKEARIAVSETATV